MGVVTERSERRWLLVKLKGDNEVGTASYPGYTVERGSSYKGISSSSSLIPKLLFEYHNLAVAGQLDTMEILEHTSKLLQSGTGWECGTSGAVRKGMWNLPTEKGSHQLPGGLMQFLPILSQVWDDISMDFMEGLPKSGGSIRF